mgnify:CR=1 FL=1
MLKKMRWRFIGAAMAAFTAVVLTLLCFVNLWNYHSVTNQQNEALTRLMEIEDQQMPFSSRRGALPFDDWSHFSPEVQYSLRFFSVHYDTEGSVLRVNQDYIASISEGDAEHYADAAMKAAIAIWSARRRTKRWCCSSTPSGRYRPCGRCCGSRWPSLPRALW